MSTLLSFFMALVFSGSGCLNPSVMQGWEVLSRYTFLRLAPGLLFSLSNTVASVSLYFFTRMADMPVADKLCNASAKGNLPEVLSLLRNGTDVNGFNKYNTTALQVGTNHFYISLFEHDLRKIGFLYVVGCVFSVRVHCTVTGSMVDFLILLCCCVCRSESHIILKCTLFGVKCIETKGSI